MKFEIPTYWKRNGTEVDPFQSVTIITIEAKDGHTAGQEYMLACAEFESSVTEQVKEKFIRIGPVNRDLNVSKPVDYSKTQTTNSDSLLNTGYGSGLKKEYPTPTDPGKDEGGAMPSDKQIKLLTDLTNPSCFKYYGEGKLDQKVGWDRNEFMTQYQKKHEAFSMNALTKKQVMYLIDQLFKMKGGN